MAKALREVTEMQKVVDLFVIVLDARAPLSTYNFDFDKLAPHKKRLFVISKIDLGDREKINKIIPRFNNENDKVIVANFKESQSRKKILAMMDEQLKEKREKEKKRGLVNPRLRVMVLGVPNSGKSTLINLLFGSNKLKVENRPGVTKQVQWVKINDFYILDSPGILWPKLESEEIGLKLAMIGSIKLDIIPREFLFYKSYELLSKYYPKKIEELGLKPSANETEIYSQLLTICKNKGLLDKDKKPDLPRGMTFFTNYFLNLKNVTYD